MTSQVTQEAERERRDTGYTFKGNPIPPATHFLQSGPTYHSFLHLLWIIYPIMNPSVDASIDETRYSWSISEHHHGNRPSVHGAHTIN